MLIDVRTAQEFSAGHAEGAVNMPLQDLEDGIMPGVDKHQEITVYCRSGGRSEMARSILLQNGYTKVTNAGGLQDVVRNK